MRKLFILCTAAWALALAGCSKKQHYIIDWEIETEDSTFCIDSAKLVQGFIPIAEATVNGKHVRLEGDIQEPAVATVNLYFTWQGKSQATTAMLVLEGGSIEIEGTPMGNVAEGTPLNDSIAEALELIEELYEEEEDYSGVIPAYI